MSAMVHVRLTSVEATRADQSDGPPIDFLHYGEMTLPEDSEGGRLLVEAYARGVAVTFEGRDYWISTLEVKSR